jgi:hypothetical protein
MRFRQLLLIAASAALILVFTLVQGATLISAQENAIHAKGKTKSAKSAAPEGSPAIEKLGMMIAGTWAIDATAEPSARKPKGGKDTGTSVIRLGPGRLSLIEDYGTHGDGGRRVALGIFWWDDKAQGYRSMFCDDHDPSGCSVYEGLGKWEGADWVFHDEFEANDKKVKIKEVLTAASPSSFTARFYRSESDGPMELDWTVKHTKIEAHQEKTASRDSY